MPHSSVFKGVGLFLPVALLLSGVMLAWILGLVSVPVSAQDAAVIRGKVVNGTPGFSVPEEVVVLMLITGPDGTLTGTGQTLTEADGNFAFNDVEQVEGRVYTLSVDYGSVFYGLALTSVELEQEQVITIYEPTEDATIMVVDRHVMVITGFDVSERSATVTEFVRFTNPTDHTLKPNLETARPGMFSFMRFALPPDAADVTVQSSLRGGEVISVGSGFALTSPVPPGEHSVDFAYTFPYTNGSVAYRNSLPQGAGIFQILLPAQWESVEVSGLDTRSPVGIQEDVYRAWEARDIPAGPGVELRLDGLPQPGVFARIGAELSGSSFWLAAIPSVMGAVLLALLTLGMVRRYRPAVVSDAALSPSEGDSDVSPQRPAIISALALLDERFQAGELNETDYLDQRSGLVARALGEASDSDDDDAPADDALDADDPPGGRYA